LDRLHDLVGGVSSGAIVRDADDDYLAYPADAVGVLGWGLLIFAVVTALAGGMLLLQAVNRHLRAEDERSQRLRELGATRREIAAALAVPPTLAAALGAVLAAVAAAPTSTWFLFAVARRVEPDPGFRPDL